MSLASNRWTALTALGEEETPRLIGCHISLSITANPPPIVDLFRIVPKKRFELLCISTEAFKTSVYTIPPYRHFVRNPGIGPGTSRFQAEYATVTLVSDFG